MGLNYKNFEVEVSKAVFCLEYIMKSKGHVCPIHTHTINKRTYTPQYSCSEECQAENIDCGKCSEFMR